MLRRQTQYTRNMSTPPPEQDSSLDERVERYEHPSGTARAWLRPDGILCVEVGRPDHLAGAPFTQDDALAAQEVLEPFVETVSSLLTLVDIRGIRRSTSQARRVHPNPKTARLALLVGSPVSRMLGNAYLGINKLPCPTKLFTDMERAAEWLLKGTD